jgi:hypothetical protein
MMNTVQLRSIERNFQQEVRNASINAQLDEG